MDEYMRLVALNQRLTSALEEVRAQMAVVMPMHVKPVSAGEYRIALRPDDHDADPFGPGVLMDDIEVRDVAMFRAEQMDLHNWWVCCYLDNETQDRITWSVSARCRPRRIDWVTTEFPTVATYEHEQKAAR